MIEFILSIIALIAGIGVFILSVGLRMIYEELCNVRKEIERARQSTK